MVFGAYSSNITRKYWILLYFQPKNMEVKEADSYILKVKEADSCILKDQRSRQVHMKHPLISIITLSHYHYIQLFSQLPILPITPLK